MLTVVLALLVGITYSNYQSSGLAEQLFEPGLFEVAGYISNNQPSSLQFDFSLSQPTMLEFDGKLETDGPSGMATADLEVFNATKTYFAFSSSSPQQPNPLDTTMLLDAGTYHVSGHAASELNNGVAVGFSQFELLAGLAVPEPATSGTFMLMVLFVLLFVTSKLIIIPRNK